MKKPKRVSLAVKVNIVIMAMVLSVSVLLTLISENAYQKAVFMPYFRKLENVEILEEELKPFLQEFLPYLGTEELNQVISESDREGTDASYYFWLLKEPGMREAPFSLYDDWMEFEIKLYGIRGNDDLHEISCIAEKDGKLYNVCTVLDNEDSITASLRDYGFGKQIPEGSPAPADYLSPKYFKEEKETWLIRCIPIGLEDGNRVFVWLKYDLTEAIREHGNFLLRCVLLTIGVTLLASVITSLVMRRFVLQPVRTLAQATRDFVPEEDGTYSPEKISRLEIRNNDEIGDLSHDIRAMQESIVTNTANLTRMTAEKERAAAELALATQIQTDALPSVFPAFPEHEEFDIFASMTPAKKVGGDFYDFFLIDERHLGIVIADVSGKGVPAALFMMSTKSLLRICAKTETGPAQAMQAVNNRICENNRQLMFVTIWFGVLDLATGRITVVNAGHEYPALMPAGGRFALIPDTHGVVIGAKKGVRYREQEIDLMPGTKIFLFTDGVTEARNAAGVMFGESRMIRALNEVREKKPREILLYMKQTVDGFVQDAAQFDDQTMLCLEYRGSACYNDNPVRGSF